MEDQSSHDQERICNNLQDAVVKCSERCLYQAAKWTAELLNSFPENETTPSDTELSSPMSDDEPTLHVSPGVLSQNSDPREARLEAAEAYKYLMAKTFFDCREYDRCAAVFLPMALPKGQLSTDGDSVGQKDAVVGSFKQARVTVFGSKSSDGSTSNGFGHLSQKALFLSLYAKYMAGEKRRDEEAELILGRSDSGAVVNRELVEITQILQDRFAWQDKTGCRGQGWLEYLHGVVLAKGKNDHAAKEWLLKSLKLYAVNWAAWQELTCLIGSLDELDSVTARLPEDVMTLIFNIYAKQELRHAGGNVMNGLKGLKNIFPRSSFLRAQKALLHYHGKDFERAERRFAKIMHTDPLRLEDMDTYSNILYVMEKRAQLAYVAQVATAIDQFRPETCCIVGNYHALRSEHEKAVVFFRRALVLDRNFAAAWTLMGHEYVELKNTQTAIACYRHAVDTNRKDFRAWYGLGQTYEILEMHNHSLHYYKQAADLSPQDPKMWSAVANVFARINRPIEAINAFKRCLAAGSPLEASGSSFGSSMHRGHAVTLRPMDPDILHAIAELYERINNEEEARAWMEICLAQEEGTADDDVLGASMTTSLGGASAYSGTGVTPTTSKARMWLARHYAAAGQDGHDGETLRKALVLANELCQDGYEVEEAKSLIKAIRNLIGTHDPISVD